MLEIDRVVDLAALHAAFELVAVSRPMTSSSRRTRGSSCNEGSTDHKGRFLIDRARNWSPSKRWDCRSPHRWDTESSNTLHHP